MGPLESADTRFQDLARNEPASARIRLEAEEKNDRVLRQRRDASLELLDPQPCQVDQVEPPRGEVSLEAGILGGVLGDVGDVTRARQQRLGEVERFLDLEAGLDGDDALRRNRTPRGSGGASGE